MKTRMTLACACIRCGKAIQHALPGPDGRGSYLDYLPTCPACTKALRALYPAPSSPGRPPKQRRTVAERLRTRTSRHRSRASSRRRRRRSAVMITITGAIAAEPATIKMADDPVIPLVG